jgi:hypothetical protein
MHEYTAAFRVAGGQLIIEDVTRTLQIQPTHVIHLGQKQQGGPAKKAVWSFEQVSPTGGQWHSLEDALLTLVSDLRQRHEEIRALQMFVVQSSTCVCGAAISHPASTEDPDSRLICCEFLAILVWIYSWTRTVLRLPPERTFSGELLQNNWRNIAITLTTGL